MSSRVRLMLQDFGNGTSSTGKTAWMQLQVLYQNWEKAVQKGRMVSKMVWKHTTDEYAGAHPFTCSRFHTADGSPIKGYGDIKWEGNGFYQKAYDTVPEPGRRVPPLPTGPKWLVAQEMWSRMQDAHINGYKLFISRDSRKHAWRKSLCNPFYQQFGWRPRKATAKKVKKAVLGTASGARIVADYWRDPPEIRTEAGRIFRAPATQGTRTAEAPKPAPVKPRVGIWS